MAHLTNLDCDCTRAAAEALGFDPDIIPVTSVAVTFSVNQPMKATVNMWLQDETQAERIIKLLTNSDNVKAKLHVENSTNWFKRLHRWAFGKGA